MSTPKLHTSLAVDYFEVPECACSSGVIVHNSCMHMYTPRAVHFTGIFHPETHSSHHQISPQGVSLCTNVVCYFNYTINTIR